MANAILRTIRIRRCQTHNIALRDAHAAPFRPNRVFLLLLLTVLIFSNHVSHALRVKTTLTHFVPYVFYPVRSKTKWAVSSRNATLRTGATWLLVAPISCPRSSIFVRFGLYLRGARAARPFVGSHRRSPHTVTLTFTVVPDARRSPSAGALPPECTYGIGRLAHAALSLWVVSPLSPPACVSFWFCWSCPVQFLVGPVNGSSHKSTEKQIFE